MSLFAILFMIAFNIRKFFISKKDQRIATLRRSCEEETTRLARQEQQKKQERKRQKDARLDLLLPGPWRVLYDFLKENEKFTREAVLLAAVTFKRDVLEIHDVFGEECVETFSKLKVPFISPVGLDALLGVSYYNFGGTGNCHQEVTDLFWEYVRFPQMAISSEVGTRAHRETK